MLIKILLGVIGYNIVVTALNHDTCKNISRNNLLNMCNDNNCTKNLSFEIFCTNLRSKVFKCGSLFIPHEFICDGISNCDNNMDEYPGICSLITCEKGFYKCDNICIDFFKLCDGVRDCNDGSDESSLVCKKLIDSSGITCPNIFLANHIVSCYINDKNESYLISCGGFYPPETKAEVRCKSLFYSIKGSDYQILTCQDNGNWNKDLMECEVECGTIPEVKISPLIINGLEISPAFWPWYCALFTSINSNWTFFCGSTIISSNLLLTAGHCVWKMPENLIKAISGKSFSDFYKNELNSQMSDVESTFIYPLYQDSLGNYGSDIAIVKLKSGFSFNEFILPICMNWTLRNFIRELETRTLEGQVAGMGITENGTISTRLRRTNVEILKTEDCIQNQRYEFKKYVTIASFCGKGIEDTIICNGDSGSGLAVQNKDTGKWTLEGIVSISPKNPKDALCDKKYFTLYTNVGIYVNWVYKYYNK
ncbi:unnamed protein product [Ceutorhynchus assimilis]|uniref:Uncharacterized protein n=1 Tax=Ceutorhynchus assimilis TaxID=467358 RepID=A0A9N9MGD9_9CUCU|nr:unnamed protein product [Ceutorhynchus assimilis]